jgi:hypothetical protein
MTHKKMIPQLVLLALLAAVSAPAFAYLDPSTGSMIISAIIGVFATLVIAAKTYWYRLKRFFNGGRDKSPPIQNGNSRDDATQE